MGIKLTDKKFFGELLNLDFPGLIEIKELVKTEDYKACRKVFAEFFRGFLNPESFFSMYREGSDVKITDELIDKAEKACRHYVVCCETPYDFNFAPIDWEFNPTYNGFVEWPFVLNRHAELLNLAKAYRATKTNNMQKPVLSFLKAG